MRFFTRILIKTQKPRQLMFAILGVLLGFSMVIIPLQLFTDFKYLIADSEQAIGSQFLVINKKISVLNTIKLGTSTFSKAEIEDLKSNPNFKRVGKFTSNNFEASALIEIPMNGSLAQMKTELFLESVEDGFLDVKPSDWTWSENAHEIPIVLPNDFINLYNFNFAPGRGLPQISKGTIKMATFQIQIHGDSGNAVFTGRIAGFSNRVSSVLVPQAFMNFANSKYGNHKQNNQSYRIIVETKNNLINDAHKYFEDNGYEANSELLKNSKFSGLLEAILTILAMLGLLIIFVSVSAFVLYFQLAISRCKYELEVLLKLGYPHQIILWWYGKIICIILMIIYIINGIMLLWVKDEVIIYIQNFGFEIPAGVHPIVMVSGGIMMAIVWLVQWLIIRSDLYQLALPYKIIKAKN